MKQRVKGWKIDEVIGIGLESLIECPMHGIVNATGALRDLNGKMICLQCDADSRCIKK